MSKKNLILIVLAFTLIIIGGLIFFYLSSNKTNNDPTNTTQTNTNPFGNTSQDKISTSSNNTSTQNTQNIEEITDLTKLVQIYKNPTSGSVFLLNKDNQNVIRFTDRAVGNIYEYVPEMQTGEIQRLTNTTVPKIQETVWSSTGNSLVLRYLDDNTDNIVSFSSKIKIGSSSPDLLGEITGIFLSSNIKQMIINPKGDKIFGLVDKSDKSGTYGFTTNLDGVGKKTIFDSPISYWNISWPKENIIAFNTKPNYKDVGLLYFFNTQTYSMDRILGNIMGMSALVNKDANLVAYSYSANKSFSLDVYDVINKISKNFKISTLAEKCVWGNSNTKVLYCAVPKNIVLDNYPDAWYQGLESFNDDIWKIDIETGATEAIYQTDSNGNIDIDAFDLKISLDDTYLSFANKKDLSLWLLQLEK